MSDQDSGAFVLLEQISVCLVIKKITPVNFESINKFAELSLGDFLCCYTLKDNKDKICCCAALYLMYEEAEAEIVRFDKALYDSSLAVTSLHFNNFWALIHTQSQLKIIHDIFGGEKNANYNKALKTLEFNLYKLRNIEELPYEIEKEMDFAFHLFSK